MYCGTLYINIAVSSQSLNCVCAVPVLGQYTPSIANVSILFFSQLRTLNDWTFLRCKTMLIEDIKLKLTFNQSRYYYHNSNINISNETITFKIPYQTGINYSLYSFNFQCGFRCKLSPFGNICARNFHKNNI